jgi:hypothetical protein
MIGKRYPNKSRHNHSIFVEFADEKGVGNTLGILTTKEGRELKARFNFTSLCKAGTGSFKYSAFVERKKKKLKVE